MSQSQRPNGARQGSVKRARELLEAGLPPDAPDPTRTSPVRQRGREIALHNPPPVRPRQPMPAALAASRKGNGTGIGDAISRPTPVPQWPLANPVHSHPVKADEAEPGMTRGERPRRPPRPSASKVPSILDGSKLLEQPPLSFQYRPMSGSPPGDAPKIQEPEIEMTLGETKSTTTVSSRPSTQSSFGSIPDFPLPTPSAPAATTTGQARRSANLGPPPTSRRGASSYYSNISFVSPIQEETIREDPAHESYASSAAIPSVWRDDASDDDNDDDDDERRESSRLGKSPIIEEGRESQQSNGDDNEERTLIRSASVGRREKPEVVITRTPERAHIAPAEQLLAENEKGAKLGLYGPMETRAAQMRAAATAHANGLTQRPHTKPVQPKQKDAARSEMGNLDSPLAGGTGLIEESSSESIVRKAPTNHDAPAVHSYVSAQVDPRRSQIMLALQAASGVQTNFNLDEKPIVQENANGLPAPRRPPRLDLDGDMDAEMRGSLTSLPDLIRRATKLAGMIDMGRRPGSRLNQLMDFDPVEPSPSQSKEETGHDERRNSGLSGMLAAFPPPGLATPTIHSPQLPSYSHRSSNGASTRALTSKPRKKKKKKRTCCGLSLWAFVVIVGLTVGVIAAAVLVPLTLLVFKKSQTSTTSALTQCQQTTTCMNGGTDILTNGVCSCICANGFTGATCGTATIQGCTTTNLYNSTSNSNVTLGDAIPRLIAAAQVNFSIPLSSNMILARFSASNLSCVAENSLVTFNSEDKRLEAGIFNLATMQPTPAATVVARQERASLGPTSSTSTVASIPAVLSLDTGAAPATTMSSPKATHSVPTASSFTVTPQALDFGRVTVLYILQQQRLDTAVQAQDDLQKFFNGVIAGQTSVRDTAGNVTLGNGNVMDFLSIGIQLNGEAKIGGLPTS